MRTAIAIAAALALAACATAPKPQELQAFEKLKGQENLYAAAQKRAPELVADSDKLFAKSRKEWESNDLDESRRDALMGSIKLRTAYALVEQDQARERIQANHGEMARAQDEYARVAKDLSAANEQVALLQKLASAKEQLGQEQVRGRATEKVKAAELALKSADTVNAGKNAQAEYQGAAELLERARGEMKAGNYAAASASADLAKTKAEQAYALSRPIFQQTEQTMADKALAETLTRDASALGGVTVKVDRRGDMQRLRIVMSGLFRGRSTMVESSQDGVLDQVAALLKKYPSYPVQVIGHTDARGRHDQLVAVSMARAQSVFTALVFRGVDPKRATVSGQGPDDPIVRGTSPAARAQNNRVEVIFLYH